MTMLNACVVLSLVEYADGDAALKNRTAMVSTAVAVACGT
jgi:hypothetical protein